MPDGENREGRFWPTPELTPVLLALVLGGMLLTSETLEFSILGFFSQPSWGEHVAIHLFIEIVVFGGAFWLFFRVVRNHRQQQFKLTEALQASETRYRSLIENLDVGIALISRDFEVLMANRAMEHFVGSPRCYFSNRRCHQVLFSQNDHCPTCPGAKTLRTGEQAKLEIDLPGGCGQGARRVRIRTYPVEEAAGGLDGFIEVVEDITRERVAAEEIQRLDRERILAVEEERKRLARDLHDQCGQTLAAVQYGLAALKLRLAPGEPEAEQFDQIDRLVIQIGGHIRSVSTRLRPAMLDDVGLAGTLRWLCNQFAEQWPMVRVQFKARGDNRRLPPEFEIALFRICQESLNNIAKHAGAGQVEVQLLIDEEEILLRVADDGCGFDGEAIAAPGNLGLGLRGMRERVSFLGGRLSIESVPGKGTVLQVRLPMTMKDVK